jgi:integrase
LGKLRDLHRGVRGVLPDRPASGEVARIRYRRQKTERSKGVEETPLVDVPILPPLAEELEYDRDNADRFSGPDMRDDDVRAVAALTRNNRWHVYRSEWTFLNRSPGALAAAMHRWVIAAGLGAPDRHGRHLTLHGLRKAMGRRLAEAGASVHMIASVLGHESVASVQTYTRAYDRAKAADAGLEMLGEVKPGNVTRIRRAKE